MERVRSAGACVHSALQLKNRLFRECLAEFLGVCILVLFGCGAVAQMVVSNTTRGEFLSVNLGFGLGATFGVYIAGGISGAHINPAVSFSLCLLGRFQWKKLPFYIFFQTLGGFVGAAVVYGVHHGHIAVTSQGVENLCTQRQAQSASPLSYRGSHREGVNAAHVGVCEALPRTCSSILRPFTAMSIVDPTN